MSHSTHIRKKIEEAAERLGATRAAVFKWRSRGIPGDWKIKLLSDADGDFSISDFDALPANSAPNDFLSDAEHNDAKAMP